MSDSLGSYLAQQASNKYSSPSQPSNPSSSNHSSLSGQTIPTNPTTGLGTTSPSTNTYLPTTTSSYSDPYKYTSTTVPTYTPQKINLDNSFVLFSKPTPITNPPTTTTTTASYTTTQPSSLYQTPSKTTTTPSYVSYQPQTTSYSSQQQQPANYPYKANIDYNFNIFDPLKPSSNNPITSTMTTTSPMTKPVNPMRQSTMRQSTIRHLSENQQQETVQSQASSLLKILGLESLTDEPITKTDSEGQPSIFSALFGSTPLAHSVDQNDKNPLYFFDQEYAQNRKDIKQLDYKSENKEVDSLEAERLRNKAFAFFCQPGHEFAKYLVLLSQMNSKKEKFIDKDFPANLNSIMGKNYSRQSEWGDCIWLSPDEFYGKNNYQVFVGGIEIGDIHQGKLGNCYFLSTLSSLAEWPNRIQRLFATKERNDAGMFCVKICEMGEWKEVLVDDLFPCSARTRKPIFTSGNDHELWVLILEKVWAKIYGSYDAIEDGLTRECLHDLTGAPTTYFFTDRKAEWEIIWKRLVNAEKNNFVMTCGTEGFGQESVNAQGIVASHAYSLISAFEELDRNGKKVRLLKIRNPWGDVEWNGAWSDSCPNWTPELRAKYNVEKKNDGIFYISYEDFLKHFEDVQICFVHDNYQYNSLRKTALPKQGSYFVIKIDKAGRYYITVNQESKRKHPYNPDWKYSIVYFRIYRIIGQGEYQLITGRNGADKEVWTDVKCEVGNYIVFVQVDWLSKNHDFVLSTYGPSLTQITVTSKQEHPNLYD